MRPLLLEVLLRERLPSACPGRSGRSMDWPAFVEHRIAVVAINFNFYGGLGAQQWVRRGDIHERLGRGKRSLFPYRVGQYLAALLASQRGEAVTVNDDPAAGADGFESCAFIQAVQCSPRPEVGRPSDAMWSNCPPRYLLAQLELLEPRLVMAVGRPTWPWVRDLCGVQVREYRPSLWRGSSNAVEAVFVNHPSHGDGGTHCRLSSSHWASGPYTRSDWSRSFRSSRIAQARLLGLSHPVAEPRA
jgi:hypothetical protein